MNSVIKVCLIAVVLVVGLMRFYQIDRIPYGFHVDEHASALGIECLATEGTGPWGQKNPIFMQMGYGTPKPPVYLYPGMLWSKIFGFTPESMRLFSVTVVTLTVLGVFAWGYRIGGFTLGLWAMLAASISPWVWVESRVAFESMMAPMFIVWGLFFCFGKRGVWEMFVSGLMFCGAMYAYPPARLMVPLLLLTLFVFSYKRWSILFKSYAAFIFGLIILIAPLVTETLNGQLQSRFNEISITSPVYLDSVGAKHNIVGIAGEFIKSYLTHLTPSYLFFHGDPSYVHSTRHFGILSWLDMMAILLLIISVFLKPWPLKDHGILILFCLINIFLSIVPSGLTNSELPNALRTSMGWPFLSMLVGLVIVYGSRSIPWINLAALLISGLFALSFLNVYFKKYPEEGKGYFNFWVVDQYKNVKTDEDWLKFMVVNHSLDYHIRFYLMRDKKQSCSESYRTWDSVGQFMKRAGIK